MGAGGPVEAALSLFLPQTFLSFLHLLHKDEESLQSEKKF